MPTDTEAQAAIAALNGKDLKGRPLTVNEARPRTENRGGGGGGGGGGGYRAATAVARRRTSQQLVNCRFKMQGLANARPCYANPRAQPSYVMRGLCPRVFLFYCLEEFYK